MGPKPPVEAKHAHWRQDAPNYVFLTCGACGHAGMTETRPWLHRDDRRPIYDCGECDRRNRYDYPPDKPEWPPGEY